jgi:hypothetical protein
MFVIGVYFIARYAGKWAESDSTTFTNIVRVFAQEGRLVPIEGQVYPNGFAYQAISTFILSLTGLDVATLQQLIYPLVSSMVVLPAWLLYRELTGSARGATITTILLFTQPEFLFVVMRSSHEKFTRTLMLLCLYFLVRSFKLRNRPWMLAMNDGLFYLAAFAFIASNNLLAHSFIFAIAIALSLGWMLVKRHADREQSSYVLRRLFYATLICLVLVYVFTFYTYPPAQHDLAVLRGIGDRIGALFLSTDSTTTNAYAPVAAAWVSPAFITYFAVSVANWIILAASGTIWLYQGLRWFIRGKPPKTREAWLLWLLFVAFAAQGVLAVLADVSGALSGNLQYRLFPSLATVAVALVGSTLVQWRPRRWGRPIVLGLSFALFCIAILSVFKATNEPMLSNKWIFYRPDEIVALTWSDLHLENAEIWTEYDERLVDAFRTERANSVNRNRFITDPVQPTTRNMILTSITRLRSSRLERVLPVPPDALRVYDNGVAELFHLRPLTPYQP